MIDPAVKGPIVSISLIDLSHHMHTKKGGVENQYGYLVTNPALSFIINMLNTLLSEH